MAYRVATLRHHCCYTGGDPRVSSHSVAKQARRGGEPFSSPAVLPFLGCPPRVLTTMKRTHEIAQEQEPLGIIISRGARDQETPRFWAYIWGPAPESGLEDAKAA